MIFHFIRREITNNLRFSLFFIFNLAIGLSGVVTIQSLKTSIQTTLQMRAKGILSADIGIGARRQLSENEQALLQETLPANHKMTRVFESFTMLSGANNSRLVELKAIENDYPFYGELELQQQGLMNSSNAKDLLQKPAIWVYPELLIQLNLQLGDTIKIGNIDFEISDIIEKDSSGVGAGFSFAPPIYIGLPYFEKTGLLRPGSTGYFSQLYRLPENVPIEDLVARLNQKLTDPAIQITTSKNASEQVGRALGYVSDYLGLAGLVALFLMSLGQIFLYRSYLMKRRQDIAILKTLGLSPLRTFQLYLSQIILLSLLATIPTLAIASAALPPLEPLLNQALGVDIKLDLQIHTLSPILFSALLCQLLTLLPLLISSLQVHAKDLLYPIENTSRPKISQQLIMYLPALLGFWLISVWLAKSLRVGSLFFALFLVSLIVLFFIGDALLRLTKNFQLKSPVLRMSLRNLERSRWASLSAFVTLGLGVLLANLIPQIKTGLISELQTPSGLEQPGLFLFDIQDEQNPSLEVFLKERQQTIMNTSPMIRARLVNVNDQPFEKRDRNQEALTREEENENRFRNRGFNLTYRDQLTKSESIVAGRDFQKQSPDQLAQISLEKRFADRLKLNVGDKLDFDVQGVTVTGVVVNFRKVRWTSFQPNFFIQFQSGYLEEAPKTFLMTLGQTSPEMKNQLQTELARQFPNVSLLDVSRVVERLSGIMNQMSLALQVMAAFCMLVGLFILFTVSHHQMHERRKDVNLLKILGADFSLIRRIYIIEFMLIIAFAVIAGTGLSYLLSIVLSWQLFDSSWLPPWIEPLLIACLLTAIAYGLILYVIQKVLRTKPQELLQSF